MANQGKKFKLHKDCIFIRLDEKSVIYNHSKKAHYTPQNESARMVLGLLTKNAGSTGTVYGDIVQNLLVTFKIKQEVAEDALDEFLNDLRGHDLLEEDPPGPPFDPDYPYHPGKARGEIITGGTFVTIGYQVSWYWG
jgi:hypothetical protein